MGRGRTIGESRGRSRRNGGRGKSSRNRRAQGIRLFLIPVQYSENVNLEDGRVQKIRDCSEIEVARLYSRV